MNPENNNPVVSDSEGKTVKSPYDLEDFSYESDPEPVDGLENEALHALLKRPGFSIRSRLILSFLLLFVMSAGISVASVVILFRLESTLKFLEDSESFTSEIQQARRFEKNYFLYGSDLSGVEEHVERAETLFRISAEEWNSVVGRKNVETMERHLESYKKLLKELGAAARANENEKIHDSPEIETLLRSHGSEMVTFAMEMARRERMKINHMLRIARLVPVAFLGLFLILMLYETNFLTRHIIRRLNRLMESTERIAQGDFTPIMPHRRFRDEFTNLAVAMNSMMRQLVHRHEILVRSHKLRAVGTLTAGVAHELNNPINNVMLTAEMLREDYHDLSDEERLDMISDLVGQAERSQKIVRNLLDFARESKIETELLDIGDIVRETVALVGNEIKLHKVRSKVKIVPNLPPVHGDKQHLSQVFLNLILNALDAMPDGGRLNINVSQDYSPSFVDVEIMDTGGGIPDHIIGSIFDPFFTTKSTGKGTGLGLSVSLGIIKNHGGAIRVHSQVGKGTTFQILLPVSTVPADMKHVKQ